MRVGGLGTRVFEGARYGGGEGEGSIFVILSHFSISIALETRKKQGWEPPWCAAPGCTSLWLRAATARSHDPG